nr:hypothetical protein [Micromonospora sp. DSM 115978]
MIDSLDRLAGPAADLFGRVDDLLSDAGAPAGHRVWPLLRRLRTLPGQAVCAVCALRPAPLAAAGSVARDLLTGYDDTRAALRQQPPWHGAGAEAFAAHRDALAGHLDGSGDSLTVRLEATAGYADALVDWITRTRSGLARTVAAALGSAEAVTVVTGTQGTVSGAGPAPIAEAAAELGARVLIAVDEAYAEAEAIPHRFATIHGELPWRPAGAGAIRLDGTTRLAL